ncbi:hypothetical protein HGP14_09550 [Rhizobium sp. P32RR-XVIII]|uniref:hypothetical protein n=1 Tax=Rhizobium sp. P32RR-XVIII TaxID=2726738 RepID=UPI0014573172|nr:hypothetical protein [Rhizobium sp. P32RR-XVIII]NLS03602.1 hypothetical protein [Rhizobium sp. P32RR-XVIII]
MSERLNLEYQVRELFKAKMEEFIAWCGENWTVTPEQAIADNIFDSKPEGYREGYNNAIEGLSGALECFLEEQVPA